MECIECDKPAIHKCAQCHVVEYCSRECQRTHWEDGHKDVCFNIAQPDLNEVGTLIDDMYEDEDAVALRALLHEHKHNVEAVYGIAGMIQMHYDDMEHVGDKYSRRARRKERKRRKWRRRKHNILRYVPGTRSYRARKRMKRSGGDRYYGPAALDRGGQRPEDFEAERRGYYVDEY